MTRPPVASRGDRHAECSLRGPVCLARPRADKRKAGGSSFPALRTLSAPRIPPLAFRQVSLLRWGRLCKPLRCASGGEGRAGRRLPCKQPLVAGESSQILVRGRAASTFLTQPEVASVTVQQCLEVAWPGCVCSLPSCNWGWQQAHVPVSGRPRLRRASPRR